jgi:SAM-dependent methyltransferase
MERWQQLEPASPHFATVSEFLRAEYSEQAVCRRLGMESLHEYLGGGEKPEFSADSEPADALDVLLRLFLRGSRVSANDWERLIPRAVREAMEGLGMLCADAEHREQLYSTVALYPVQGLHIASDRWTNLDGSRPAEPDFVFPAIHPFTHDLLGLLPQKPCEKFLDLCSGTAVAALLASRNYSRQSWAVDITARATQFGEFNRRLNQVENVRVLQGNLYEPVAGLKFDRIVAHPPFVPSLDRGAIYADGGEDGEFVTRALVQRLPQFLEADGCCYCGTMGIEREGEPYERRVREWLGGEQSNFDVLFITERTQSPALFAYRAARNKKGDLTLMDQWLAHLEKLGVQNLAYGLLVMQRKGSSRNAFTVRRQRGERSRGAEIEWLRNWETKLAGSSGASFLLQSRPRSSAEVNIQIIQAKRGAEFIPTQHILKISYPFVLEYECSAWVATFVTRCDGKTTARKQLEAGRHNRWLPPEVTEEQFAQTLGTLISMGVVEIEGFDPPG